jgi:hypothetical protein
MNKIFISKLINLPKCMRVLNNKKVKVHTVVLSCPELEPAPNLKPNLMKTGAKAETYSFGSAKLLKNGPIGVCGSQILTFSRFLTDINQI